jgi:hypothetical protein
MKLLTCCHSATDLLEHLVLEIFFFTKNNKQRLLLVAKYNKLSQVALKEGRRLVINLKMRKMQNEEKIFCKFLV